MMRTCLVQNTISEILQLPETGVAGDYSEFLFQNFLLVHQGMAMAQGTLVSQNHLLTSPSFKFLLLGPELRAVKALQRTAHRNSAMDKW